MSLRLRLALLALITVACGGLALRMRVTTNLVDALPSAGEAGAAFRDIERFSLLDTLWIEIDGTNATPEALHAAIDALGEKLSARPDFSSVRYRFGLADGAAIRAAADPSLAVLTDEATLADRLSADGMARMLARAQARLFSPAGSMVVRQLEADPLDLGSAFTEQALSLGAGGGVKLDQGHLLATDGRHAILFARANTPALGTTLESQLVAHIQADLAACPLPANWLGSHRFAAEAEHMIKGEVNLAVTMGIVLVLAVFLISFRSLRPLLGAIPPTLVGAAAAGAAAALVSPIHGMALAFGGALAGMGVDYWIHLYLTGIRDGVPATFQERLTTGKAALAHLMPAYLISVAATSAAFFMLTTSSYPSVSDLGWIGIAVALGALASVVIAGPIVFAVLARPGDKTPRVPLPDRIPGWVGGMLILGLGVLAVCATGIEFDGDPRSMDARIPETSRFEEAFSERYGGGGTTGLVVAEGASVDDALEKLLPAVSALYDAPGVTVQSPLSLLPPPSQRRARAALAASPDLSARFAAAADAAGFESAPLLVGLHHTLAATAAPTTTTWKGSAAEDIIGRTVDVDDPAVAAVVSGVTEEALEHARHEVALSGADVRFVHPAGVATDGAERIRHELVTRSGLALLGVLVFMVLRYRDVPRVLAAALPSLAAAGGTLGALSLAHIPLTPVSGPAFVLILGVAFDQGIFLVEANRMGREHFLSARAAIVIALCTALAGFAGLLAADHPAVWSVGIVVTLGIAFTAVGAFVCVPVVLTASGMEASRRWGSRVAFVVALAVALDTAVAAFGWLRPPRTPEFTTYALDARSPTDRRYGPNRLARVHGTWVLRLEGTAFEIGRAAAVLAGDMRRADEEALVAEFRKHVPSPLMRYLLIRGTPLFASRMAADVPAPYLEEIAGGASIDAPDDYAWIGPRYTRKFCYHAIHDLGQAMVDSPILGCTGFAAGDSRTTDGHWIAARNWDFDGGTFFDEDKAVIAVKRKGAIPFVHVAIAGLTGAVSGVNEAGIAIVVLAAGSDASIRFTTPMTFIVREALERATSIGDVEKIMDKRRGFVTENVLVVDGARGKAAVLEVTPEDVHRIDADELIAVSNHLRGPHALDGQNTWRMEEGTTVARLARIQELTAEGEIDLPRAIAVLRDRNGVGGTPLPAGHESALNGDNTSHSVIIDATVGTVTVSRYPNVSGGYARFRLADLMDGDIVGEVVATPENPEVAFKVHAARALTHAGGEEAARKALRLNPGNPVALLAVAEALLEKGDALGAAEAARAALATPPAKAKEKRAAALILAKVAP